MKDLATNLGPFRVLIYQESEHVLVHGIDHDLVSQGPTREEAIRRFWKMVVGYMAIACGQGLEGEDAPKELLYNPFTGSKVPRRTVARYLKALKGEKTDPEPISELDGLFFANQLDSALTGVLGLLDGETSENCTSCQDEGPEASLCPTHQAPILEHAKEIRAAWRARAKQQ